MKKFYIPLLLALFLCQTVSAAQKKDDELTFEGKTSAQITRNVSVPYPIIVDEVYVKIGDHVKKDQRLLKYHMQPKIRRAFQNELLNNGGEYDREYQMHNLNNEIQRSRNRRSLSAELVANGLGSKVEDAQNAKTLALQLEHLELLKRKREQAQIDFATRLEELESYMGVPLKGGEKLPDEFYITAPMDGTIIYMAPQDKAGGYLASHAFTLSVLNPIQVQIQVHESEITKLYVGQPVTVDLDNDKNMKFTGEITMLSWQPVDNRIAIPSFYFIWVDVQNPDYIIKPGYKVIVHVQPKTD